MSWSKVPVPSMPDRIRVEDGDWHDGQIGSYVCDECGCRYDEHVKVPGYWWLRRLCNGDLVKIGD